jgi:hypothetical protein
LGWNRSRCDLRRLECRILPQNRPLELVEGGRWLDPEALDEQTPGVAVDVEGIRLTAASVEREHQLAPQTLPERVFVHEPLDLCDQLEMTTKRQLCVDPVLERGEVELLESRDRGPGEGLVCKIGQRRTAPQLQGPSQARRRRRGIAASETT